VEKTLAAGGVGGGSEEGGRGLTFVVEKQREIAQQRIEVSGLEAQLQTVRRRIEEQRERLKELPEQSLKLAQLQRERRSAEEMYGYLREQMQQTQMALESEIGYAEVIQPAGIPRGPVSPDKQRNLILAAMLGLLLGGGLVYLREQLDTYLRVPEDVNALGHSVVGVIPSMDELLEEQFGGAETVELDGTEVNAALVMLTSSMSSVAESYRRLRANLRFARPDADLQSLAVTSPGQGEGKTTTATNLALATASAGQTTLLVDADLRHPRVHSFLGRAQSPGLTEALYRPSLDLDDYATSIDDLYVMAAGEEVPNPSEQLGSERMRHLVARLEEIVDTVIVDTPPVLLFSDPLAVAPYVDGSLLVARAHETARISVSRPWRS
jgi:capsular exopolysaccharide synthesis family protein